MDRRTFLASAAVTAGSMAVGAKADTLPLGNLSNWRYPDPRVEVLDKRFKSKVGNAAIERIATGFRWAEGPVYIRDYRRLIWSDIPNNRMMSWNEEDGHVGYGIFGNYEGHRAESEQPPRVYRLDGKTGQATVVIDSFDKPNGLAFSPDEKKLYI